MGLCPVKCRSFAERGKSRMKKQALQTLAVDLIYDIVGSVLFSVGIYTFAKNSGFSTGGISGLGLMLNHLTGLPIGTITLLLNIPVIFLSYKMLGRSFLLKSLKTMVIQTAVLDLVLPHFPTYIGSQMLAAVFTGVLTGAGLVIIYMRGSSTGGTDFLILSLKKLLPHLSIGQFSMLVDGAILLLAGFVYGNIDATLYGLVATFACTQVIDKVMYGAGSEKLAFIITRNGMNTAAEISKELDRGSTLIKSIGTFSGEERDLLLCACSKSQIFKVRGMAHTADPGALVMITEVDEVYGEGFKPPQQQ